MTIKSMTKIWKDCPISFPLMMISGIVTSCSEQWWLWTIKRTLAGKSWWESFMNFIKAYMIINANTLKKIWTKYKHRSSSNSIQPYRPQPTISQTIYWDLLETQLKYTIVNHTFRISSKPSSICIQNKAFSNDLI